MTIKIAKLASLSLGLGACLGLAGCAAQEQGATQESVTTRTSAIVTADPRCADGTVEETFGGGVVGCAGTVTWDKRRNLCGGGYRPVKAAEWAANAGGGPMHHYWTDDHLNYNGTGPGACWVSLTGGGDCGDTPMRVCKSSFTDPEGNQCNWQDCGLDSAAPDRFFGGCGGNTTAGTLCIPSACADGTVEETFTGGLVGCAGKVSWDNRQALCSQGYRPATAAEWIALGGVAPQHHYWTDDDLHWGGVVRPGVCFASATFGNATPSGTPMRVCASSASDPEGNGCLLYNCGFDSNAPNRFFGGCVNDTSCANNTTAGTLCLPEGCADGTVEQVFPNGMKGCAGTAASASAAAPLCAPGYRLATVNEFSTLSASEIRSPTNVGAQRNYWTQTMRICAWFGCGTGTTGGALCVPQRGCADGTAEQVMPDGFVGCGGAVSWANRDSLCGRGYRTATSAEWKTLNSFSIQIAPTHDYWTADQLKANGSSSACWVSTITGSTCGSGQQPMRLCTSSGNDAEGNTCNWRNCGINTFSPNRYFGGCASTSAGALCVPDAVDVNHQSTIVNQDPRVMDMINSALSAYPETPAMAVAVVVDDKIFLGARGKRKATDTTETLLVTDKFQQNSVSKTIAGTVSARVVDQGSLSWGSTLGAAIPSIFPGPFPDYANVTLAELHAHASGFDYDSTAHWCQQPNPLTVGCQPSPPPDAAFDYNSASYPTAERKRLFTRDYTRDYPLFAHGTGVLYGTGPVAAISMVEQTLSQTPYDSLLEDFIFRPLMMKHSGTTPDVFGHPITIDGGGIITVGAPQEPEVAAHKTRLPVGGNATSIEDLARFARATLYSPRDSVHFWSYRTQQSLLNNVGLSDASPSGWFLSVNNHAGGLEHFHNGGEGKNYSWIAVWPERRLAVAAMTNCSGTRALDSISDQAVSGSLFAPFGVPSPSFPHQDAPSYRATSGLSSTNKPGEEANNAFDGNYDTDWAAQDSDTSGAWLKVTVPPQAFVGHVLVNETRPFDKMSGGAPVLGRGGDHVQAFRVTSWQLYLLDSAGAEWLAATGTTLGVNKLIPVNGYNVTGARLVMNTPSGGPAIKEMHLLPW